jgi:hypothetical protein
VLNCPLVQDAASAPSWSRTGGRFFELQLV